MIGDLLDSQLLYPRPLDAGVSETRTRDAPALHSLVLADVVASQMGRGKG